MCLGPVMSFSDTWLWGRARPSERSFVISAQAPCPRLGDTYKGHNRGRFLVINQQGNLGRCVLLVPVPLSCLGLVLDSGGMISYKMEWSNINQKVCYMSFLENSEKCDPVPRVGSFVSRGFNCCECCLCKVFPWIKVHILHTVYTKHQNHWLCIWSPLQTWSEEIGRGRH